MGDYDVIDKCLKCGKNQPLNVSGSGKKPSCHECLYTFDSENFVAKAWIPGEDGVSPRCAKCEEHITAPYEEGGKWDSYPYVEDEENVVLCILCYNDLMRRYS